MNVDSFLKIGYEVTSGFKLRLFRGRGSFGCVWEAANEEGDTLAIKMMPCTDGMAAAKEIRALQTMKQLYHPNLIRIEQVWCAAGNLVVSMELADGSLMDLLEAYQTEYKTALEAEETCYYLFQAARALDYLNTRQHLIDGRRVAFQHCDVKPSNLVMMGDVVKVADLGLAVQTVQPVTVHPWAGTPDYSAPELFQGRITDWSDQYSLAVSYCQLRGGRLPFPAVPETLARAYTRPAPDLSMLTEKEKPIIARALSLAPQQRWPSCVEMMTRLSQATAPEKKRGETLAASASAWAR